MKYLFLVWLLLCLIGFNSDLFAATKTWDGGGADNNWQTAANWDLDVAPVAGDALVFAGSTRTSPNNDFAANTSFASITFSFGASAFTLSGNAVTITGGASAITGSHNSLTMAIGINITFGTAAPTITTTAGGTLNLTGTIDNGGFLITVNNGGPSTFSGIISGTGGISKSGAGTLILSAANTYTGTTTISGGTLQASNSTALGSTAAGTTISTGGTFNLNGYNLGQEAFTLSGGTMVNNGADQVNAIQKLTVSASSSIGGTNRWDVRYVDLGSAGVTVNAAVTLTKQDANQISFVNVPVDNGSSISVTAGSLALQLGTTTSGTGNYTIGASGAVEIGSYGSPVTITNPFIINGGMIVDYDATGGNSIVSGTVTLTGACSIGNTAGLTISGVISGTGSLSKIYGGALTLSAANTHSGGTNLSAGTLNINSTTALGTGTFVISNGTTIDNTSGGRIYMTANNPMTWSGDFTYTGTSSLNLGSGAVALGASVRTVTIPGDSLVIGGIISGTGGITKAGAGILALGGVNTYSGTTTISAGTLNFNGSNGSSNSSSIVNNSILYLSQTASPSTVSSVISGTGALISTAADVRISGNNTYSGLTTTSGRFSICHNNALGATSAGTVVSGELLIVGSGYVYAAEPLTMNSGATFRTSFNGVSDNGTWTGNITLAGNANFNGREAVDFFTITGIISGGFNVTKNGAGKVTFSAANTYTGRTNIDEGILSVNTILSVSGGASALGAPTTAANGTIYLGSGANTGILEYTGTAQTTNRVINLSGTTGGGTIDQSGTGALVFSSNLTATGNGAKTLTLQGSTTGTGTLSGVIVNSASATSLVKTGTGTWTLSGANTFTGGATLTTGQLNINHATALGTGTFAIANGTVIDNTSGATVTMTADNPQTWNGNFTFTGSNALDMDAGAVDMGAATRTVTTTASTLTLGGIISNGGLSKAGSGALTLSGANTFASGVALTAGKININNATALGIGTLTISNGTTIDNTSGGLITMTADNPQTWNGDFTFNGTNSLDMDAGDVSMGASLRTVTVSANTLTVGGNITGTGGLTKNGNGTLKLGVVNAQSWTGTTTVDAGTLYLNNQGFTDNYRSTAWVVNNGGTLFLGQSNVIINTAIMTINTGGTFDMNTGNEAFGYLAGGGSVTNNGNGGANWGITLDVPATGTGSDFSGVISGGGELSVRGGQGSGKQILSGLNNYTGITSVQNGTLSVNTIYNVSGGASAMGAPTTIANGTIKLGATTNTGTLEYTGTTQSTDRVINLNGTTGGATITQSGTGPLTFASNFTATGVGAKTLTLQGSTAGDGVISGAIVDGSGTTSLAKSGTGTWTLSGANTYTGTTTTNAGTLRLGASGVIPDGSNFVAAGGTFSTGAVAGFSESLGTLTVSQNTTIALGTGSHNLSFAASNGATWSAGKMVGITGWQGGFNCSSGTSGKIYTGNSAELSGTKLSQFFFVNPGTGLAHTACQLSDGEIVPTSTLPVRLIAFEGNFENKTVVLKWITASEINSDYFEIMRSSDGVNFEIIGKVKSGGNSIYFINYDFVDDAPLNGMSYYKLVEHDLNGSAEEFKVIAINNTTTEIKSFTLYPNPATELLNIKIQSPLEGTFFLTISDVLGQELYSTGFLGKAGENLFKASIGAISSGVYFVKIITPDKVDLVNKIVIKQ